MELIFVVVIVQYGSKVDKTNIEQVIGDSDENVRGNIKEAEYEVKIELC